MRSLPLTIAGLIIVGLVGAVALVAGASQGGRGMAAAAIAQVDAMRRDAGIGPLPVDDELMAVAQSHAEALAASELLHVDDAFLGGGVDHDRVMVVAREADLDGALRLLEVDTADAEVRIDPSIAAQGAGAATDASGRVYVVRAYRGP